MNRISQLVFFLCVSCLLSACAPKAIKMNPVHDNFYSTLWLQTASESKALAYQVYQSATRYLDEAVFDSSWTASLEQHGDYESLPTAVILDVDETVLDNARFQANMVLEGILYDEQEWDRWVSLASAPALPGAVEFINKANELGVEVFYITNRECYKRSSETAQCPQKVDTINNLRAVGIKEVKSHHVMLKYEHKDWLSEKLTRRNEVVKSYRVLMLLGDDLGDFLPHVKSNTSISERNRLVKQHAENWGSKWFILSNPTYGSWMNILGKNKRQHLKGF